MNSDTDFAAHPAAPDAPAEKIIKDRLKPRPQAARSTPQQIVDDVEKRYPLTMARLAE